MQIAAMTMVYNELELTQLWVSHYEKICGRENLYVFAHGGDEDVVAACVGCNVIYVPRHHVSKNFNPVRWGMMASWVKVLHESYDAVFIGDIDEYCFVDPEFGSVQDLLKANKGNQKVLNCFCLDVFVDHNEPELDISVPIFAQRSKAMVNGSYCKPLVSLAPIQYHPGAHSCDQDPYMPEGLYMAHMKYASIGIAKKTAEMKQRTTEENGGIEKFRGAVHTSWLRGLRFIQRTITEQRRKPSVPLDDNIAALRSELTESIGTHPRRKGKLYTGLPMGSTILEVPERFAKAF